MHAGVALAFALALSAQLSLPSCDAEEVSGEERAAARVQVIDEVAGTYRGVHARQRAGGDAP